MIFAQTEPGLRIKVAEYEDQGQLQNSDFRAPSKCIVITNLGFRGYRNSESVPEVS
jgi:hypothetical protein